MTLKINSDAPTTVDTLGFIPYRDALINIALNSQTPIAVGIFGQWGSGKTSLMRMIQEQLDTNKDSCCTVWFNAWKYDQEDALWRAMLLHLINKIRSLDHFTRQTEKEKSETFDKLDKFEQSLYHTVEWEEFVRWSVDWAKAISNTTELAADVVSPFIPGAKLLVDLYKQIKDGVSEEKKHLISDAFHKEVLKHRRDQVLSLEQFEDQFKMIVRDYILPNQRLVIFVDDLDRCLPENIIKIFEAIKLFMDVEGCVFILGFDLGAIQEAVKQRFFGDEERGRLYLEKIIQLPFYVPPIESGKMAEFIKNISSDLPDGCQEIFNKGLRNNPREAKRVVNIFLLLWQLVQSQPDLKDRISAVRLAKFVVIQNNYPKLYDLLCQTPRYLQELERYFIRCGIITDSSSDQLKIKIQLPEELQEFGGQAALRSILLSFLPEEGFTDLTVDDVSAYVYLFYRIQAGQAEFFPFEPQMIKVNGGKFNMGIDLDKVDDIAARFSIQPDGLKAETPRHLVTMQTFDISKYPITNREYKAFIDASCHPAPKHWENDNFPPELGDHPIVNVDWEDANEYCLWLSQKTKKTYRLPTEAEWEYVARGTRDITFPWGDEWDKNKCNTKELKEDHTTFVGFCSPSGDSWCGCADIAGNVFEWVADSLHPYPGNEQDLATEYNRDIKILRGGSWNNGRADARVTYRNPRQPDSVEMWIGFRCVRELANQLDNSMR